MSSSATAPPAVKQGVERSRPRQLLSGLAPAGRAFLDELTGLRLLDYSALGLFLKDHADRLQRCDSEECVGAALVQAGLLTAYQLDRVLRGATRGLVLGSYRLREEIGRGGMGVVYRAEHALLGRRVAVKVLPLDDDCPATVRQRFRAEMQALAALSHPNIVAALDAGEEPAVEDKYPALLYLVMELVEGGDLDRRVREHGRCDVIEACRYIHQAAAGLQAAHDHHLVHRDIKPSNLLLSPSGQVKLVDFGLARQFFSRLTDPRTLLGSVEFMAPEQSHDPSGVGKEADIYGLGATLFWLLTGEPPYPFQRHVGAALRALQQQPPRRLRALRPDAPEALDALLAQMLDRDPARRPASPLDVLQALAPFLLDTPTRAQADGKPRRRVLVVDDEVLVRRTNRMLVETLGCECVEASTGAAALAVAGSQPFDLVLLDLGLPDLEGYEVCRRLRARADNPDQKVIIVSGAGGPDELAESLTRGADDYVAKPFSPRQLLAKAEHALRLKETQDRGRQRADQMQEANLRLRQSLEARANDVREAHNALLFTLAKMAESRDGETAAHMRRLQSYALILARQAALAPPWRGLVDARFLDYLARCVPLHDLGKIGLPDELLHKTAALTAEERKLVEAHPLVGDRILEVLGREHGAALEFLGMARAIVRHHHERWDGQGYPDGLAGEAIPPAARLTAVADVYDTLRRKRLYKPAVPHLTAVRLLRERSPGQFDPTLLDALGECHEQFERVYRELAD
jgi:response regulator RpfG family c-di-GMP phosphodiesterase